jgi:hypothetical protein
VTGGGLFSDRHSNTHFPAIGSPVELHLVILPYSREFASICGSENNASPREQFCGTLFSHRTQQTVNKIRCMGFVMSVQFTNPATK